MKVDPGTFFILVGTLAAGGVAGYAASSKRMIPALDNAFGRLPDPPPQKVEPDPLPTLVDAGVPPPSAAVDAAPPEPPCDDSVGTVGACPPPGYPAKEGGCGSFAHTRCKEIVETTKPRVAEAAVACLNKLTPKERCDPSRVNLCAHLALMNACPEKEPPTECETIGAQCSSSPIPPSAADCRQTLSGMNALGRERTMTCMKAHCFDKGLIGCEATSK
jgi:hypothetical protein